MKDKDLRWLCWAIFIVIAIALAVRVPAFITVNAKLDEKEFAAANDIARDARKHMVHVQNERIHASIDAVRNGTPVDAGWR
jgi:hypothetical protein